MLGAASTFIDTDCQTRRCFKGIDMEVGRTEDLVPTLMDPAVVPVTKGCFAFEPMNIFISSDYKISIMSFDKRLLRL